MPDLTTTYYKFSCLFSKRNPGSSQKNRWTGKGEPFPQKSRGFLCKGSRLVVYRFIDQYKTILGLHHISFDTLSGQEQCGRSRLRIARSAPPPRSSPPAAAGASPPSFSAKMALAAFKKSTWVVCSSRCGVPHFSPPSNLWLHCQMVLRSGSYLVLCEPFPQKKG